MKRIPLTGAVASFLVAAFVLVPDAALAQDQNGPRTAEQLVIDVDRSEQLFQEALRLEADDRNNQYFVRAAERYVESAELRPYGDGRAYVALNRAGQFFSHAGKATASSHAFAAAGLRGLETGQVYEAAMAFVNAAEQGQQNRQESWLVLDYLRIAHRLSESPALTAEQRQQVRFRMGLTEAEPAATGPLSQQ